MTEAPKHASLAPLLPEGEPVESLLRGAQFFTPGTPSSRVANQPQEPGTGGHKWRKIGVPC